MARVSLPGTKIDRLHNQEDPPLLSNNYPASDLNRSVSTSEVQYLEIPSLQTRRELLRPVDALRRKVFLIFRPANRPCQSLTFIPILTP